MSLRGAAKRRRSNLLFAEENFSNWEIASQQTLAMTYEKGINYVHYDC
jgi:hypothetical protein